MFKIFDALFKKISLENTTDRFIDSEITINISKDPDYHTQIDNKYVPLTSCNTTSFGMALVNSGIKVPNIPEGMQLEDYFTKFLRSKEAYDYQKKYHSWSVKDWAPQEVHAVLSWAINKLVGKKVTEFHNTIDTRILLFKLLQDKSSVLSGKFNGLGHIVCLSGFVTTQQNIRKIKSHKEIDLEKVTQFIIDDPYGNYKDNYKDHYNGNNIYMPKEDWLKILTKSNSWDKRAHIII